MRLSTLFAACSLVFLGLGLAGCTSAHVKDITVEKHANPKADLSGYDTYAWYAAAAVVNDPDGKWKAPDFDLGAEIRHLTNRELRAKGWTEVVESPDVVVIYAVGVDMKSLDVVVDEDSGLSALKQVPRAAVEILLVEPDTRRVVWAGMAEGKSGGARTVEVQKERLDYAITQMFK